MTIVMDTNDMNAQIAALKGGALSMARIIQPFSHGKMPQMHCIRVCLAWPDWCCGPSFAGLRQKFIFDGFNYLSLYLNRPNAGQIINLPIKSHSAGGGPTLPATTSALNIVYEQSINKYEARRFGGQPYFGRAVCSVALALFGRKQLNRTEHYAECAIRVNDLVPVFFCSLVHHPLSSRRMNKVSRHHVHMASGVLPFRLEQTMARKLVCVCSQPVEVEASLAASYQINKLYH